jgi:formate dehydrogenase beta subunit
VLRFFRNESCGKCVPCRVGSAKAHEVLSGALAAGGAPAMVEGRVRDLEETLRKTSICGLGQVALGPVVSVLGLPGRAGPGDRDDRGEQQRSP